MAFNHNMEVTDEDLRRKGIKVPGDLNIMSVDGKHWVPDYESAITEAYLDRRQVVILDSAEAECMKASHSIKQFGDAVSDILAPLFLRTLKEISLILKRITDK